MPWISFEVRKFSDDLLTGLVLSIDFFSAFIEQVKVKEVTVYLGGVDSYLIAPFIFATVSIFIHTGNRDLRGGPILLIDTSRPDWGNVAYTSVELMRLFMYYYTIPK